MRLAHDERKKIERLSLQGESLNSISRILGKPKSTVYYHCRKLNGLSIPGLSMNFSDQQLGEFIGVFAGDGGFHFDPVRYKYSIQIHTGFSDSNYNEALSVFLTKIFGKKPRLYVRENNHTFVLQYYSKELYELIRNHLSWNGVKSLSLQLRSPEGLSPGFLKGFLRGLFDTDGNYYRPKRRVVYATASNQLAKQVLRIMNDFGYNPSLYKNQRVYRLDLYGVPALSFLNWIRPRNQDKVLRL